MKHKLDKVLTGFLAGVFVPIIALLVYYLTRFNHLSLKGFFRDLSARDIMGHIISLCAIPNLLIFFIFIWLSFYKGAKGVIISTFIYAFVIVGIRYF